MAGKWIKQYPIQQSKQELLLLCGDKTKLKIDSSMGAVCAYSALHNIIMLTITR